MTLIADRWNKKANNKSDVDNMEMWSSKQGTTRLLWENQSPDRK